MSAGRATGRSPFHVARWVPWAIVVLAVAAPHAEARQQLGRVAIVSDRSDSIERKSAAGASDGAACAAVRTFALASLTEGELFRKGELLAGLGHDSNRPDDPVAIDFWLTAAASDRGTPPYKSYTLELELKQFAEGAFVTGQRNKKAGEIVDRLTADCTAGAVQQNISPLYSVLTQAVSSLLNGCPANRECLLMIQSDLAETVDPAVKKATDRILKGGTLGKPTGLPSPIDLKGRVSVFVCGYGVSRQVVSEQRRTDLVRFWRDNLLINSKRWEQQSQCPGYQSTR